MIRRATIHDMPEIKKLAEEFTDFNFNAQRAVELTISNECIDKHILLVLDIEGKITGVSCGILTDSLINQEKLYQDLYFYIQPKYRGYTKSLINEVIAICKEKKIDRVIMASLGDNLRLDKLYEIMGFKLLEKHFYINIP